LDTIIRFGLFVSFFDLQEELSFIIEMDLPKNILSQEYFDIWEIDLTPNHLIQFGLDFSRNNFSKSLLLLLFFEDKIIIFSY